MNKNVVMSAIKYKMEWIFNKVLCNPLNLGKDMRDLEEEIKDLYSAYIELRGSSASVSYVAGVCSEMNTVQSIYDLTKEREQERKYHIIDKRDRSVAGELKKYSFEELKYFFKPESDFPQELKDEWEAIEDVADLENYLKLMAGGMDQPYSIETETEGE